MNTCHIEPPSTSHVNPNLPRVIQKHKDILSNDSLRISDRTDDITPNITKGHNPWLLASPLHRRSDAPSVMPRTPRGATTPLGIRARTPQLPAYIPAYIPAYK